MNFLFFQTDVPNGVRALKNEKKKKLLFLLARCIENTTELISDIKNYEGVIDFKLIVVMVFGTKM
jgi:hypothetical protein